MTSLAGKSGKLVRIEKLRCAKFQRDGELAYEAFGLDIVNRDAMKRSSYIGLGGNMYISVRLVIEASTRYLRMLDKGNARLIRKMLWAHMFGV